MDDLSNRLDKISVNSNEMDQISSDTKKLGSKGLSMIDILIEKSNKTEVSTKEVDHIVQDMNESTKQINAISETLESIQKKSDTAVKAIKSTETVVDEQDLAVVISNNLNSST